MTIGGSILWFWNEMPEASFQGWFTDPGSNWQPTIAATDVLLYQNATTQLAADVTFDHNDSFELDYNTVQLNPGSRIIYPPPNTPVTPIDREAVGLDVGDAPTHCSLTDTRMIVALSNFDGGRDAIMSMATTSAAAEGNPAPQDWSDVVHDQTMYDFLFKQNMTVGLATATFAYVSVYVLPTCADRRLFFVSDDDFMGPVTQDR